MVRASICLEPLRRAGRRGVDKWQLDFFDRRAARQQVESLKHKADLEVANRRPTVLVGVPDVLANQREEAFALTVEQSDQVHRGGLAGGRRPHDADELAGVDIRGHRARRGHLDTGEVIEAGQLLGLDQLAYALRIRDAGRSASRLALADGQEMHAHAIGLGDDVAAGDRIGQILGRRHNLSV